MKATSTYAPTKWDEKPYEHIPPSMKMTKASVEFSFKGQMEGHGLVEYLMFYTHTDDADQHNSKATYVGLIRFTGTLNGVAGGFAMEDRGTFEARAANSVLKIIPGSGTDGLKGITGTGRYTATPKECDCELSYELK